MLENVCPINFDKKNNKKQKQTNKEIHKKFTKQ